jgi:LysM repeat protein
MYSVEALKEEKAVKTITVEKGKTYEGLAIEIDLLQEESGEKK